VSSALWPTKNFSSVDNKEKIAAERIINSTLLVGKDIKLSSFYIYLRVYFKKHISEILINDKPKHTMPMIESFIGNN
jgi:hypothetical protein